ncbi:hypothetical protein FB45DRAFT_1037537 [Roridomyces roridus]|uniref:Alcohol dehydrogenase n=1 Tax=Roridomyces roridus TaxID=1738132 RepID=A0AAD7B6B6_9AGAR|nr:hypothetical protein FB45DRAFT_1037537 [Roridomyces roridus]
MYTRWLVAVELSTGLHPEPRTRWRATLNCSFEPESDFRTVWNGCSRDIQQKPLRAQGCGRWTVAVNFLVGISAENQVFNTLSMVGSGVQIHGSSYGPRSALVAALDLFSKEIIQAHVSEEPLENVNEIIEELRSSDLLGRKVVVARV